MIRHGSLWLAGDRVRLLELNGSARVVRLALECPRVEAYGPPADVAAETVVERFSLGETSIVHDRNRVAVLLDLSTIELPPLCQFVGLKTDTSGRLVDFERLEFVGVDKLQVVRGANQRVHSCACRLRSTARLMSARW